MRPRHRQQTLRQVFVMPIGIGVLSLVGLVSALTGDGVRDAISWAALAVPVLAVGWAIRTRRS